MLKNNLTSTQILYVITLFVVLFFIAFNAIKAASKRNIESEKFSGENVANSDETAVPDAATATNLQLVSVYPNAAFGANGLLVVPVLNVLAFLLGNWITLKAMRPLLEAIKKHKTPHKFAAVAHDLPKLHHATAWISLLVFAAITMFEVVFLSKIGQSMLGGATDTYYFFVTCLVLTLAFSAVVGGQATSILADRWLLLVAYIGLHLSIGYLILRGSPRPPDLISVLVLVMLCWMCYKRLEATLDSKSILNKIRNSLVLLSTLILVGSMLYAAYANFEYTMPLVKVAASKFIPSGSGMTLDVFIIALLAAIAPAIFYNFIDFSFWQKYHAEISNYKEISEIHLHVKKSFWLYLIESPLSWLLPVLLGVYAVGFVSSANLESNPLSAILIEMKNDGVKGGFFAFLLFASFIAISTSTICSYLASAGYLFATDLTLKDNLTNRNQLAPGYTGIVWVAIFMVVILVPIEIFLKSTDQLILFMLTFFAPLCALSPLIVWPLFRGKVAVTRFGAYGIYIAIGGASLIGLGLGFFGVISSAAPDSFLFWAPLPISFFISWVIYLFSIYFFKKPLQNNKS